MNIRRISGFRAGTLFAVALGLVAGACDNPVDPGEHGHHPHAEAVVVRLDGEILATAEGTDGNPETRNSTGSIEVPAGGIVGLLEIEFVDHDGHALDLDDDDASLGVIVDDETVATFDPDPKGGFAGRVHGHTAGSTTISFILMHGDHAEFTTEPIVIDVLE